MTDINDIDNIRFLLKCSCEFGVYCVSIEEKNHPPADRHIVFSTKSYMLFHGFCKNICTFLLQDWKIIDNREENNIVLIEYESKKIWNELLNYKLN